MADHIGCVLEDAEGNIIKNPDLNFAALNELVLQIDEKGEKYVWLHTIDEYGNTVFNHLQGPLVTKELEQLKTEAPPELQNLITAFINFFPEIRSDVHQYLKFYGD